MQRQDLAAAVDALPQHIRDEVTGPGATSLSLLDTYLDPTEQIHHVCSGSVQPDSPRVCVFAITSRRLLFVAPAPQVVGYRLSGLSKAQAFNGYFFLEGDAGKYSPGIDKGYGEQFAQFLSQARALSVLTNA